MKYSFILMCVFSSLLTFEAATQKKDPLGASDAELQRLNRLNMTSMVVSIPDAELREVMVGKWTTGRHDYEYMSDGTWRMLPVDTSTTKGTWRVENQRLIENGSARIIMEASHKQIVLKNDQGTFPYRYVRIEKRGR